MSEKIEIRASYETYEVESIIDSKENKNGNKSYLVKWKGYSDNENTW